MFEEQSTFNNNKISYFRFLRPTTRKNIAIASLVALSRLLVNKKTTAVTEIKDLSSVNLKLIPDQIEEKIETVDRAIQTDNVNEVIESIDIEQLCLEKLRNLLNADYRCNNLMEWEESKRFISIYWSEFEFGIKHQNLINNFIKQRYSKFHFFHNKQETFLNPFGNNDLQEILDNIQTLKNSGLDFSFPVQTQVSSSLMFKMSINRIKYFLYQIQLFQKYNSNVE